ncbi:MAG TPA: EAL domain-containing protein [Methylophilaceae bacterium]|nr:EAL domain-containing protein [Methylophilaceae bacterium]
MPANEEPSAPSQPTSNHVLQSLKHWLRQATEPVILFPTIAILVLALIWGMTYNLARIEHAAADHAARVSSHELAETYEAQVLRSLREINQNLLLVKYIFESRGSDRVLEELRDRALTLPDLLFTVSIADAEGNIVQSTGEPIKQNIAGEDFFESQREGDELSISQPWRTPDSQEWKLQFSRRLNDTSGSFAGVVVISVDAAYFVSGYETSKLGEKGLLALLGSDGVFRVRRTGDFSTAGGKIDYASLVPDENSTEAGDVMVTSLEGISRYVSARQLFDLPLAVVVGLSREEQLAAVQRHIETYLWRAAAGTVVLLFVIFQLYRLSRELVLSRQRAVEEQMAHAQQVEYLAFHDGLTGLPNRSLFSKLLSQHISNAKRYDRKLAVLFLDLDRFKQINDTLGHDAGDDLLKEVARRLRACLRESDTVARMGGDEFVAILPELEEEGYSAAAAKKILAAVAQPFTLAGQEYRVTVSIGISTFPQDGEDEQTLTKTADIAMYQAKQEGKNNFQFYSDELNANSLERLALESGLRHALDNNEFELHYQAKRDSRNGQITGMEALLRWNHADLGTVAPLKFIPVAEESGLIIPIGRWVLRTACAQNVAWQQQGLPRLSISVNMTARQFFDDNLLRDITKILKETKMDPSLLELEITESLLMRDVEKTLSILNDLKNMGVLIAIDDFGTGYSSLTTLQQFPLNTIKIDRSFIKNVAKSPGDKALTEAIIAMGRALSLTVVAQGVETKAQADFLRRKSCDEFQGFYFHKPVPADEIPQMIREQDTS